jgi:hypothetical protein
MGLRDGRNIPKGSILHSIDLDELEVDDTIVLVDEEIIVVQRMINNRWIVGHRDKLCNI